MLGCWRTSCSSFQIGASMRGSPGTCGRWLAWSSAVEVWCCSKSSDRSQWEPSRHAEEAPFDSHTDRNRRFAALGKVNRSSLGMNSKKRKTLRKMNCSSSGMMNSKQREDCTWGKPVDRSRTSFGRSSLLCKAQCSKYPCTDSWWNPLKGMRVNFSTPRPLFHHSPWHGQFWSSLNVFTGFPLKTISRWLLLTFSGVLPPTLSEKTFFRRSRPSLKKFPLWVCRLANIAMELQIKTCFPLFSHPRVYHSFTILFYWFLLRSKRKQNKQFASEHR